jgi:hypothetical protein
MQPLSWHMAGEDIAYRVRLAVLFAAPAVFLAFLIVSNVFKFNLLVLWGCGFAFAWLLAAITNELFRHPSRSYVITDYSILVTRGGTTKQYRWPEFECFYEVGVRSLRDSLRKKIGRYATTRTFYLKRKRPFFFPRTFVVVYVDYNISQQAKELIAVHVPERPATFLTDSGLVRYEFR